MIFFFFNEVVRCNWRTTEVGVGFTIPHLHAIHGFPDLVQVVGRTQRLQPDVGQLEFFLPQLVLELQDDLGLGFGALAQPIGEGWGGVGGVRRIEEGVIFGGVGWSRMKA